jgi:hypothetical protein
MTADAVRHASVASAPGPPTAHKSRPTEAITAACRKTFSQLKAKS